jgi:hypothetical protein
MKELKRCQRCGTTEGITGKKRFCPNCRIKYKKKKEEVKIDRAKLKLMLKEAIDELLDTGNVEIAIENIRERNLRIRKENVNE